MLDSYLCCREAGLAQLVEQLICNQQVAGSSPILSSNFLGVHVLSFSMKANFEFALIEWFWRRGARVAKGDGL